jgi:hypothetical protein
MAPVVSGRSGRSARSVATVNSRLQRVLVSSFGVSDLQVHYPFQFKVLATAVLGMAAIWAADFFTITPPNPNHQGATPPVGCEVEGRELADNANTLWYYFLLVLMSRLVYSIPRVTACIVDTDRNAFHRPCRRYCLRMLVHGPLYMFCLASALFCVQLVLAQCAAWNEALYQDLMHYGTYSCMVSIMCFLLAVWQDRLIAEASREQVRDKRRAPEGTLESITTVRYDPSLFGEGEDKLYHSECPICLMEWNSEDRIKVTSCAHAFHEECLGAWLRTNRTCALCRRDLAIGEAGVSRTSTTRTATTSVARGANTEAGSLEPVPAVDDPELGVAPQTIGAGIESVESV